MATEIEPLIMPFDPLWVTTSKREYREAVRRMGEEPGDTKGKDGLTSCIPGKGCVIWISRKVKAPDLYALAAHEATHAACDMLASIGGRTSPPPRSWPTWCSPSPRASSSPARGA